MKLAIIGAAGLRTPMIIDEIINRQDILKINDLVLMDIDKDRLELITSVAASGDGFKRKNFTIQQTTDPLIALDGVDFVITTFRVGGMQSRVIDEKIPLEFGILGQETTGPGGFAMGIRSIPILADYVRFIQKISPNAWLINFANPSGMMTEAISNYLGFERIIGICDGPVSILKAVSKYLAKPLDEIKSEYFGLNHLGWFRSIKIDDSEILPLIIQVLKDSGGVPGLDISPDLISAIKMIPNEYLYYYYHSRKAVQNIISAGVTRGEQLSSLNDALFAKLRMMVENEDKETMCKTYVDYIQNRISSYMKNETRRTSPDLKKISQSIDIGYAEIALDLIESISTGISKSLILNIPNHGAISGMHPTDVVEIPVVVNGNTLHRTEIGEVPDHCLGLMKQVKSYEKLTIEAALERSYEKALTALSIHPLIVDYDIARKILDGYLSHHGSYFSVLS